MEKLRARIEREVSPLPCYTPLPCHPLTGSAHSASPPPPYLATPPCQAEREGARQRKLAEKMEREADLTLTITLALARALPLTPKAPAGGKLVLWRSGAEADADADAASELPDTSGWEALQLG